MRLCLCLNFCPQWLHTNGLDIALHWSLALVIWCLSSVSVWNLFSHKSQRYRCLLAVTNSHYYKTSQANWITKCFNEILFSHKSLRYCCLPAETIRTKLLKWNELQSVLMRSSSHTSHSTMAAWLLKPSEQHFSSKLNYKLF